MTTANNTNKAPRRAKTTRRTTKAKTAVTTTPRLIQWQFQEGPPRRSLYWYAAILAIGVFITILVLLLDHDGPVAAFSALIWVGVVYGLALAPRSDYTGQLDGDLLTIHTAKHRPVLERNLREFASWKVDVFTGDRLNPDRQWLVLQRRDGHGSVDVRLPAGGKLVTEILERVNHTVPLAPDVAPTPLDRFFSFANRWIGWWR